MRRIQDTNVGPGDTFISANPNTNEPGTIVRKDHKNDVQEELCRAIESTGQPVDTTLYISGPGNRDQIAQMAAHYGAGGAIYFIEDVSSAADAYAVKPVQIAIRDRKAPAALFERQQIVFPAGATNTGASTVDVSLLIGESLGTTIVDIKLKGGTEDLAAGDIVLGEEVSLIYRQTPTPHFELQKEKNTVITKSYESGEITIVSAGSVTLNHGLTERPKIIECYLKCLISNGTYRPGDEVVAHGMSQSTTAISKGVAVIIDNNTEINLKFGSNTNTFNLIKKATGTGFEIINANWKLILRAYA